MNSKERFQKTINRETPDRAPLYVSVTPQVALKLCNKLNEPYQEPLDSMLSTRASHMDLIAKLGADAVGITVCAPINNPTIELGDSIIKNEWGMIFKDTGKYNEFHEFPLAHAQTAKDIEEYGFPDPFAIGRWDAAQKTIDKYGKTHGIIADLETTLFETAWYLVGLEKFMMDMMMEADYINPLLDKIQFIHTEYGKKLIELGADVLWCGDDFGSQTSLMMDPDSFRRYFKPRIKAMFAEFKNVNPNIKLAWHSCGAIKTIIPDFIEVGLDILNPIQPLATGMEPQELKDTFGKELIFFGGMCVQDLLPNGTPEEIKAEAIRRAGILGKDGGYIIAPAHNIQEDTSVENILALFEVVKQM
ncbi:uroporphyrinogen decarboxylase family protein [Carboxylicivirga sp. RSCT41]|uniref:uroporphyrinogen decarboxylase family protein n=1 Tax=Carboxylicivirga agarovorans TaxID=3417570 RepID=UPI003D32BFEA